MIGLDGLRVVVPEVANDLAASQRVAAIERFGLARVRLTQEAEALRGVAFRIAGEHGGRLVGGAVVDYEDFEVRIILGEDAVDGARQPLGPVVGRNHDRDGRGLGTSRHRRLGWGQAG